MLHCLGLPLLTILLPVISQFAESEAVHIGMVILAVPVTLYVVRSEFGTPGSEVFIAAALTGLCLLVVAVAVPALHDFETVLTVSGGIILGGAHLWRWFHLRPQLNKGDD